MLKCKNKSAVCVTESIINKEMQCLDTVWKEEKYDSFRTTINLMMNKIIHDKNKQNR